MASNQQPDLTHDAQERIISIVRSLADDNVDRGVDLNRPMRCDSCDREKSPLGSSQYGAYALCNDCLLEFTLSLARGDIENVAEYMTRRPDDNSPVPNHLTDQLAAEHRLSHSPASKRGEKLRPSNEPC